MRKEQWRPEEGAAATSQDQGGGGIPRQGSGGSPSRLRRPETRAATVALARNRGSRKVWSAAWFVPCGGDDGGRKKTDTQAPGPLAAVVRRWKLQWQPHAVHVNESSSRSPIAWEQVAASRISGIRRGGVVTSGQARGVRIWSREAVRSQAGALGGGASSGGGENSGGRAPTATADGELARAATVAAGRELARAASSQWSKVRRELGSGDGGKSNDGSSAPGVGRHRSAAGVLLRGGSDVGSRWLSRRWGATARAGEAQGAQCSIRGCDARFEGAAAQSRAGNARFGDRERQRRWTARIGADPVTWSDGRGGGSRTQEKKQSKQRENRGGRRPKGGGE